jgi:hypothetical protein
MTSAWKQQESSCHNHGMRPAPCKGWICDGRVEDVGTFWQACLEQKLNHNIPSNPPTHNLRGCLSMSLVLSAYLWSSDMSNMTCPLEHPHNNSPQPTFTNTQCYGGIVHPKLIQFCGCDLCHTYRGSSSCMWSHIPHMWEKICYWSCGCRLYTHVHTSTAIELPRTCWPWWL